MANSITISDEQLLELWVASTTLRQSALRIEAELVALEDRLVAIERAQIALSEKLRTNPDASLAPHSMSLRLTSIETQMAQMTEGNRGVKMWLATVSTGVVVGLIVMLAQNLRWGAAPAKATPHAKIWLLEPQTQADASTQSPTTQPWK
jgi:hypothetical protein